MTLTNQPEVISLPDIGVELLPIISPELVGCIGVEEAIVTLPPLQYSLDGANTTLFDVDPVTGVVTLSAEMTQRQEDVTFPLVLYLLGTDTSTGAVRAFALNFSRWA